MTTCPHCALEIHDELESCPRCGAADGYPLSFAPTAPEMAGLPPPGPATPPPADVPRGSSGYVLGVMAAGVVGAAATLLMLGFPGRAGEPAASGGAAVVEPVAAPPAAPPPSAPGWTNANRDRWVSNHPRSVAFELPARQRVAVWMDHVRPVLVVRCLAQSVDAFVVTETAAAMERQDSDHTVHLAFDEEPAGVARWPDSVDHDALFAPDGEAFARRLASARTLRFGFTPHNAAPVSVDFDLSGADHVVAEVTKTCAPRKR